MRAHWFFSLITLLGCGGRASEQRPPRPLQVEAAMTSSAPPWSKTLPQRGDAAALFAAAPPLSGALAEVLLLCRFNFPQTVLIHGAIFQREGQLDPMVIIQAPDGGTLMHRFGFNLREVYLSVPLIKVAKGDEWSMRIYDQGRLKGDDWVTSLKGTYQGALPLKFSSPELKIEIECRARSHEDAQALAKAPPPSGVEESLQVKPRRPDGGFQDSKLPAQINHVEQLAALLGWSDPIVQAQVEATNKLLTLWDEKLFEALPTLGDVVTVPSLPGLTLRRQEGKDEPLALTFESSSTDTLRISARLSLPSETCPLQISEAPTPANTMKPGDQHFDLYPGESQSASYATVPGCATTLEQERVRPRLLFIESNNDAALFWLP